MDIELLPAADPDSTTNQALILAQVAHGSLPKSVEIPEGVDEILNDIHRVIENVRSMAKDKGIQVIGIAGAVPNEGTSTLSSMISLMMAGAPNGYEENITTEGLQNLSLRANGHSGGRGILLVDTQWQRPSLHKIFGTPIERGLSELLPGEISTQIALKNIPIANLRLITAGNKEHASFTNHLYLDKLQEFLGNVKSNFEFVLLDLPSILHSAEGIALSKLCDGLILVVRANLTRWQVVKEAKRLLEKSKVEILGGILNRRDFHIPKNIYRRL